MATTSLQLPPDLQRETGALQRQVGSIKVVDADTYTLAIEIGRQVKQRIKVVKEFFAPMKRRADEAKRAILDAEQTALIPLEQASEYLNVEATRYRVEQERIARQQREAAQELERQRIAKQRADEAAAAAAQGKAKLAAAIQAAPIDTPVVDLPPSRSLPTVSGIRKQMYWKFEITDPDQVPREWCAPDTKRIGEHVRDMKEKAIDQIPGVRVYHDDKTF
jgi:hypothetical protein